MELAAARQTAQAAARAPDPEAVAAAIARKQAQAEGGTHAPAGPAPGSAGGFAEASAAPGRAPEGPGYLVVPGTASTEDWTSSDREHDRRLKELLRAQRKADGAA